MQAIARLLSNILIVLAISLLLIGLGITFHDWHSNKVANQKATQLIYDANHGLDSTVPATIPPPPSSFDNYTVAPNEPRYIFIPKLSVQAIIKPLGLTSTGQIATPNNVYDAGWYQKSSSPGQPGATVIDGHVSSWTTNGVFYGLKTLQTGDAIQIERGDGIRINYSVIKKRVYGNQQVDIPALLSPIEADKPGLNLITCTGDVIKDTDEFTQRVVVFATETFVTPSGNHAKNSHF